MKFLRFEMTRKMQTKKRNFKMIIFDMDGTLLNSFDFHTKCFQQFFHGYDVYLELDTIGRMIGNTIKLIFNQTLPEEVHEDASKELTRFYIEEIDDLIEEVTMIEGALGAVEEVRKKGLYTALLSNSKTELVEKIVSMKGIGQLFDEIKGADDVSLDKVTRCKVMLDNHRLKTEEALYVGDTSHDVVFARAMGMPSCLILNELSWIHKENIDIDRVRSDYVVGDIAQVPNLI